MNVRAVNAIQNISARADAHGTSAALIDSAVAWRRLAIAVVLGTIGSIGMWSVPVALPAMQAEFGIARGDASLPYTLAMLGFGLGGIVTGRLSDRLGIVRPVLLGVAAISIGYVGASLSPNITLVAATHLLIGFGASSTFGPLMADLSQWFLRRRGIAVAIASCGNYLAGVVWPPLLQHVIATEGWRTTHVGVGVFCALSMPLLVMTLRRRTPMADGAASATTTGGGRALGISPNALMALLCVAGVGCCVAMSMPQVHIVAYCGDLGYGVARGAEMLSLMLGMGIFSRIGSGLIADRIGGVATLLLGSVLQGVSLSLFLVFDGMASLYVISALFGLFQGGIVPMYAIIVREYYPPREAGTRLGIVLMASLVGMALGGWMSGAIFDFTGSYQAAFINGLIWNLLNVSIMLWLLMRPGPRVAPA
jgi:MFS family permease